MLHGLYDGGRISRVVIDRHSDAARADTDAAWLGDRSLAHWRDLIGFEVHPVITSAETAKQISPRL